LAEVGRSGDDNRILAKWVNQEVLAVDVLDVVRERVLELGGPAGQSTSGQEGAGHNRGLRVADQRGRILGDVRVLKEQPAKGIMRSG
jgi:hypothetical protein